MGRVGLFFGRVLSWESVFFKSRKVVFSHPDTLADFKDVLLISYPIIRYWCKCIDFRRRIFSSKKTIVSGSIIFSLSNHVCHWKKYRRTVSRGMIHVDFCLMVKFHTPNLSLYSLLLDVAFFGTNGANQTPLWGIKRLLLLVLFFGYENFFRSRVHHRVEQG